MELLLLLLLPIPLSMGSKAWVCSRSVARITDWKPGGNGYLSIVGLVCCHGEVYETGDYSSRGVLLSVVCLSVIMEPQNEEKLATRAVAP